MSRPSSVGSVSSGNRQVERTSRHQGRKTVVRACAITSLPPERADAARLLEIWCGHRGIENRLHWVRDVIFGEDLSHMRTGSAPRLLVILGNLVISMLRLGGVKNMSGPYATTAGNTGKL